MGGGGGPAKLALRMPDCEQFRGGVLAYEAWPGWGANCLVGRVLAEKRAKPTALTPSWSVPVLSITFLRY